MQNKEHDSWSALFQTQAPVQSIIRIAAEFVSCSFPGPCGEPGALPGSVPVQFGLAPASPGLGLGVLREALGFPHTRLLRDQTLHKPLWARSVPLVFLC